jgi:hypothetical protein
MKAKPIKTTFITGEEAPRIAGRKGAKVSPWRVPYNKNALRTIKQDRRIEMIRRAAK